MSTSTLGSSKSLTGKTIGIALAAGILVLGIIGWAAGWFGSSAPEQAATPAVTTEQPAAPAAATTQQPAAPATQQ